MSTNPFLIALSRRGFIASSAALALAGAFPRRAAARQPGAAPPRFFSWEQPAPGIWVASAPGRVPTLGGNSTLILGAQTSTLVDTKYPVPAAALRREAASFGRPLATVINTHHHADHTGGNLLFTPDLPVLAHSAAIPRILAQFKRYTDGIPGMAAELTKMKDDPANPAAAQAAAPVAAEAQDLAARIADLKPEQFAPTRPIDLDTDLDLSGQKARALHPGPAHTDNDIALFLPASNTLITGDFVFSGLHPFLDRASGGTSVGWVNALDALDAICDDKTVIIPGHGPTGGRELLHRQSDYLNTFRDLMAQAVKEGKPREEAVKAPLPAAYTDYGFQQIFPATLAAIYDEAAQDSALTPAPSGSK